MHPYPLALGAASVISAACAGTLLGRSPWRRDSQMAGLLLLGSAWWAMCQVAWNLASDADSALWLMRLASPGWLFAGPLALHVYAGASRGTAREVAPLLPAAYATSAAFLVLTWSTDLILRDVVRTSWGWSYRFGPGFLAYCACLVVWLGRVFQLLAQGLRRRNSAADKRQHRWLWIACSLLAFVTISTDVVFPLVGLRLPLLGTISFAALGLISVWSVHRCGHFMLSPGNFAGEILETLPDGVLLVGPDESVRVANAAIATMAGYPGDALIGMREHHLIEPVEGPSKYEDVGEEYALLTAGGERLPVAVSITDLRDRQGNAIGHVLVVRDLREIKELHLSAVQSARLAAVGELAAGIAHEINNPIAFVRSNLNQLQSNWQTLRNALAEAIEARALGKLVGEGNELIDESIEGVDRAAEIVRGIRGFSHAGSEQRYYVELPKVLCTPQELKQIFVNLIVNAGHALAGGGTLRIRTRIDGKWVLVDVEDDGDGIPADIIERIFDPFFTTKNVGEGSGLGLGIAYRIARSHGGDISVESTPGKGARFRVRLPAYQGAARDPEVEP
jgi:PAS domain S-box-containing protein